MKDKKQTPKKVARIEIKISKEEKEEIKKNAKANGITVSEYIRLLAQHKTPVSKEFKTAFLEKIVPAMNVLLPIGNNLNQLARAINATKKKYGDELNAEEEIKFNERIDSVGSLMQSCLKSIEEIGKDYQYLIGKLEI